MDVADPVRAPVRAVQGVGFDRGLGTPRPDVVAEELPVALVYNGHTHAVMLATPADLEAFALGFSLSEGIIAHPDEFDLVQIEPGSDGASVQIAIPGERFQRLVGQGRNLPGRSGCGLCGRDSLAEVMAPPPRVRPPAVTAAMISAAFAELAAAQPLNSRCHGLHAAGYVQGGRLRHVCEDVGRHNALDKLIGTLAREGVVAGRDGSHVDGFVVITSRASYEIVHKSATAGIGLVAAISAPTGLAIDMAERTGLTLVAFARGSRMTVYAGSLAAG